jgi:hypothetical protein
LGPDNKEQEHIDGAGDIEHSETEKHGRRGYMVVIDQ